MAFEAAVGPGVRVLVELGMEADGENLSAPTTDPAVAMLEGNLLYSGFAQGNRPVVSVGQKKAIDIAVRNISGRRRWSKPDEWLAGAKDDSETRFVGDARPLGERPLTGAMPYG